MNFGTRACTGNHECRLCQKRFLCENTLLNHKLLEHFAWEESSGNESDSYDEHDESSRCHRRTECKDGRSDSVHPNLSEKPWVHRNCSVSVATTSSSTTEHGDFHDQGFASFTSTQQGLDYANLHPKKLYTVRQQLELEEGGGTGEKRRHIFPSTSYVSVIHEPETPTTQRHYIPVPTITFSSSVLRSNPWSTGRRDEEAATATMRQPHQTPADNSYDAMHRNQARGSCIMQVPKIQPPSYDSLYSKHGLFSPEPATGPVNQNRGFGAPYPIVTSSCQRCETDEEISFVQAFFKCQFCDAKFPALSMRTEHENTHVVNAKLNHCCGVCHRVFDRAEHLYSHVREHYNTSAPFRCDKCYKSFPSRTVYLLHKKISHKETQARTWKLPVADDNPIFPTSSSRTHSRFDPVEISVTPDIQELLRTHRWPPSRQPARNCEDGGKSVPVKASAPVNPDCDLTNPPPPQDLPQQPQPATKASKPTHKKSRKRRPKSDHLRKTKTATTVKRSLGGSGTDSPLVESESHVCRTCGKRFKQVNYLKSHMNIHRKKKHYSCDVCGKKDMSKSELQHHYRIHTGEKPYLCEVCDGAFRTRGTLVKHMRIHTGEKPYQCKFCPVSYKHSSSLKYHETIHTGIKMSFQCRICWKKFAYKNYLTKHMRMHTEEKPHKCEECDAAFLWPSDLKRHVRNHQGIRPYWCEYCDKWFPQGIHLKNHLRKHTGEKPFGCGCCGKHFRTKSNLIRHRKLHVDGNASHDVSWLPVIKVC